MRESKEKRIAKTIHKKINKLISSYEKNKKEALELWTFLSEKRMKGQLSFRTGEDILMKNVIYAMRDMHEHLLNFENECVHLVKKS